MTGYRESTDLQLAALLSQGDRSAYTEIFERYSRVMYVYAKNLVRDKDEAEDMVQDVFTSLWDKSPRLELKGSLSSYLYSAVRYKFINLVAKKRVRTDYAEAFQLLIDEGDYNIDSYINEKELLALIEKEVAKLPEKMRKVFELSRNAGLSHNQIAQQLNLSEKTVKNHINHALKVLRGKFEVAFIMVYLLSK
ncbi:RNA polymerase sigma factor [Pedobacter frigoris]|uniref:RNA polymerase sigma-70 factor n=1 Tax=Pedobacter frigoris TaxID=2571272 RepID=A0A4V5NZF6_9SPHI|nr:RNA polymerase sigma-70 factor [Pedobacter frigoris]TKC07048.1 RNA polymerase sigma-70 factor [Pedobacter frigoris]